MKIIISKPFFGAGLCYEIKQSDPTPIDLVIMGTELTYEGVLLQPQVEAIVLAQDKVASEAAEKDRDDDPRNLRKRERMLWACVKVLHAACKTAIPSFPTWDQYAQAVKDVLRP